MSIYESGVRQDRRSVGAGAFSSVADVEPGRLRRPMETIGRAHLARTNEGGRSGLAEALIAFSRLIFPIVLLAALGAAAFMYGNEPARWLGNFDLDGKPFPIGLLALPVSFFVVHLTNRRYGAGYATAQVTLTIAFAVAALFFLRDDLDLLRRAPLPSLRLAASFGGGLFLAQLFAILVFDRLRGPKWWQAPLFASAIGGIVLCLAAFPGAYAGTGAQWSGPMFAYMGMTFALAVAMVVPYWMLRSLIEPLSGFGGY